jgi:hypothetical protein
MEDSGIALTPRGYDTTSWTYTYAVADGGEMLERDGEFFTKGAFSWALYACSLVLIIWRH